MSEFTRILNAAQRGDSRAWEELWTLVYDELRGLAAWKMAKESANQTLQPTALVHEVWLKLSRGTSEIENRKHFFVCAANAMRRILIDRARRKATVKRGRRQVVTVDFTKVEIAVETPAETLLVVDEALQALAAEYPEKADLVKLRFFVGMTTEEAAGVLGITLAEAKHQWLFARSWLYRKLKPEL